MGRFRGYRRWRRMGEEAITSGRQKALREATILLDLAIIRSRDSLLDAGLRRLMRNCGRRGRSRNLMLAPNLLPKAVPHSGSRLLLGLIVRPDRQLVEGRPPLGHTPPRPSRPPEQPGAEVLT